MELFCAPSKERQLTDHWIAELLRAFWRKDVFFEGGRRIHHAIGQHGAPLVYPRDITVHRLDYLKGSPGVKPFDPPRFPPG